MKNIIKKTKASILLATIYSSSVLAELPQAPQANQDSNQEGYIGKIQSYMMDGIFLLGLLIGTYALFRVAQSAIQAYGEISDGKGTYASLVGHLVVGVVLISGVIYLVKEALKIFGM
jgi:integrating conjugative element membrane protein (TIGR03745 family)